MNLLEVQGLRKTYPAFRLEDVSFSVPEGAVMGLIGRNGAGKSTTLKSILGLVHPDAGRVEMFGREFSENERYIKENIGVVLGGIDFYPKKKVRTITDVTRRFYSNWQEEKYRHYLDLFAIDENKRVDQLSSGMRVKYLLALALSHNARLLILDEPTSFLDIRYKLELLTILKDLVRERSVAVVLSLHELDLAQKISDRVICVANGEIARVGTPEEVFTDGSVQRLYGLTAGSYDERFGSLELEPVRGAPQALVIGGGGSGIALYRALQRHGIPFAAGVLHENDMDFPVARALACEIVSEQPYQPIGNAARSRARALMHACRCVYAPLRTFGPMNEGNRLLIAEAAENGWLVSAISPKKPDAT